ncbi:hypothetical protein SteCoe_28203 [Stentor coeruleus]|uniref:ER membrane protein complex subunit 7 beta-sandwich domain-containing protein n=1 Tax=Stentor coeruleus TaxID=5963 RepID=A0A1R2B8S3_9CILI|nr:hypothetical protein SteCoe_28203 [Stentor coeruleus]
MFIFLILSLASSASITGEVYAPKNPSEKKTWNPLSIKVHLNGYKTTYLDTSNSFIFHNVPDGIYVLEVLDPKYSYKTIVLEVLGENVVARDSNIFKGERIAYPLRIQTDKKHVYFEEREAFSIMSILMNPMLLMTGFMLAVAFLMPKMKMDPEQMQEMKEMQKQMNSGWMSSLLSPPS